MTLDHLTTRTLCAAANRRIAASSVAFVACGYERSLRPCAARFSPAQRTICEEAEL